MHIMRITTPKMRSHKFADVSAYLDRSCAPFKKTISELAWGSYVRFGAAFEGLVKLSIRKTSLI